MEAAYNKDRDGGGDSDIDGGKPVSEVGHWYLRHDEEWKLSMSKEERAL